MATDWDLSQWKCDDSLRRTVKEIKEEKKSSKSLPIYQAKTALKTIKLKAFTLFHLMNQDQINKYLIPTHK